MARAKQRDPRKEAHWRMHLQRQQASGGTARAYCRLHGLAESAFHYWRREIARRDRQNQAVDQAAFVPVVVESPAESAIEVMLASGHVVRVRAGFDAEVLRQLLALLETPAC
jgi:desulfoferrodoxin (superoxide reductase-like protein)